MIAGVLGFITALGDTLGLFVGILAILSTICLHVNIFVSLIVSIGLAVVIRKYFRQFYMLSYAMNIMGIGFLVFLLVGKDMVNIELKYYAIGFAVLKAAMLTCRYIVKTETNEIYYKDGIYIYKSEHVYDQHEKTLGMDPSSFMIVQILISTLMYWVVGGMSWSYTRVLFADLNEKWSSLLFIVLFCLINLLVDYFILRPIDMKIDKEYGYQFD